MKQILTYKGAVMTWECDSNRHMNVMYYINKFEHGGRNFIGQHILNDIERDGNVGIVVLEHTIKYLKEVFEDDLLHIESTLLEIGNKAFKVFHEMYNTKLNEKVSTMEGTFVLFDKATRKALPFPAQRREELIKQLEC